MTNNTNTFYKRIALAKLSFGKIVTSNEGSTGRTSYKYANLAQVIEAIREPLINNDIDFIQQIEQTSTNENILTTSFIDLQTNEVIKVNSIVISIPTLSGTNIVQNLGAAITYFRRYSLLLVFGLGTEDDDAVGIDVKNKDDISNKHKLEIENGKIINEFKNIISNNVDFFTDEEKNIYRTLIQNKDITKIKSNLEEIKTRIMKG